MRCVTGSGQELVLVVDVGVGPNFAQKWYDKWYPRSDVIDVMISNVLNETSHQERAHLNRKAAKCDCSSKQLSDSSWKKHVAD